MGDKLSKDDIQMSVNEIYQEQEYLKSKWESLSSEWQDNKKYEFYNSTIAPFLSQSDKSIRAIILEINNIDRNISEINEILDNCNY